jgi:hypothetical protein
MSGERPIDNLPAARIVNCLECVLAVRRCQEDGDTEEGNGQLRSMQALNQRHAALLDTTMVGTVNYSAPKGQITWIAKLLDTDQDVFCRLSIA